MFAPVTDDLSGLHRYRICTAVNNRRIFFEFDRDTWFGGQPCLHFAFRQPAYIPFSGIAHHPIGAIFGGTAARLNTCTLRNSVRPPPRVTICDSLDTTTSLPAGSPMLPTMVSAVLLRNHVLLGTLWRAGLPSDGVTHFGFCGNSCCNWLAAIWNRLPGSST